MIDFSSIRAMTFDCYGTLIDWETGILGAVEPILRRHGADALWTPERVLSLYARFEREIERGPYMPYRLVLREVMSRFARELGAEFSKAELGALADSIRDWPAFPDTAQALRALQERFRLCVVSNIDRDLFAGSAPKLGVRLDALVTAEDVRSYKPGRAHFDAALRALGLRAEQVLHVAESKYHDIAPARLLGFPTCWVNRHAADLIPSASGSAEAEPDFTVGSLSMLAVLTRE